MHSPAANRHQRTPSRGPNGVSSTRPSRDDHGHPAPHVVAVGEDRGERGEHEERRVDVDHPDAAGDVGEPVADEQDAGDRAEQRRAGEPAGDADDEQDAQRPGERGDHPPADRVVPEHPLPERHELLGQRRVHDELVTRVVLVPAVAQRLPGLRDVVLLVEDRRAVVGGPPQVPHPHDARDQREHDRDDPAAQPVGRHRAPEQALHAPRARGEDPALVRGRRRAPPAVTGTTTAVVDRVLAGRPGGRSYGPGLRLAA